MNWQKHFFSLTFYQTLYKDYLNYVMKDNGSNRYFILPYAIYG